MIVDLGTVPVASIVVVSRVLSSVITCPPITGDTRPGGIHTRQRHQKLLILELPLAVVVHKIKELAVQSRKVCLKQEGDRV